MEWLLRANNNSNNNNNNKSNALGRLKTHPLHRKVQIGGKETGLAHSPFLPVLGHTLNANPPVHGLANRAQDHTLNLVDWAAIFLLLLWWLCIWRCWSGKSRSSTAERPSKRRRLEVTFGATTVFSVGWLEQPGGGSTPGPPPPPNGEGDGDPVDSTATAETPPSGPRPRRRDPGIKIVTWNIISGRQARLEMVLRTMGIMEVDFGLLTETKLTDDVYTRSAYGYTVVATSAVSHVQGGVAFFYRDAECFVVESVVKHGPNVISCELVSGSIRQPIVGAYIPPTDSTTLEYIGQALNRFRDNYNRPILMGDLNVDLTTPRGERATQIAALLSDAGLEDMLPHFRQRRAFGHCNT